MGGFKRLYQGHFAGHFPLTFGKKWEIFQKDANRDEQKKLR